jgi:hypothetical protein
MQEGDGLAVEGDLRLEMWQDAGGLQQQHAVVEALGVDWRPKSMLAATGMPSPAIAATGPSPSRQPTVAVGGGRGGGRGMGAQGAAADGQQQQQPTYNTAGAARPGSMSPSQPAAAGMMNRQRQAPLGARPLGAGPSPPPPAAAATAPQQYVQAAPRGGGGGGRGGGGGGRPLSPDAGTEEKWQHLAQFPNQWWDNRTNKTNPRAPDYKYKSRDINIALWLTRWVAVSHCAASMVGIQTGA